MLDLIGRRVARVNDMVKEFSKLTFADGVIIGILGYAIVEFGSLLYGSWIYAIRTSIVLSVSIVGLAVIKAVYSDIKSMLR